MVRDGIRLLDILILCFVFALSEPEFEAISTSTGLTAVVASTALNAVYVGFPISAQ